MNIFCDTSVLVAGSATAHPHFSRAVVILQDVANGKVRGYCASHSLAELYSALTNLPVQPRITPTEASAMIARNVRAIFKTIDADAAAYEKAISASVARGLSGGAVYDALLIECARQAQVDRIYTFNVRHFLALAPDLSDRIAAP